MLFVVVAVVASLIVLVALAVVVLVLAVAVAVTLLPVDIVVVDLLFLSFLLFKEKFIHIILFAVGLGTGWIMASQSSTQTRIQKLAKSHFYQDIFGYAKH